MPSEHIQRFLSTLENVIETTRGWTARCPAHNDSGNSLRIVEVPDGRLQACCEAEGSQCTEEKIVAACKRRWEESRQKSNGERTDQVSQEPPKPEASTESASSGAPHVPKTPIPQRWNFDGCKHVLIVADEKEAEQAKALGFRAVCNPHPDGFWRPDEAECFRGKDIRIFMAAGKSNLPRAQRDAIALFPYAQSVRIAVVPNCAEWTTESLKKAMKDGVNVDDEKIAIFQEMVGSSGSGSFYLKTLGELMSEPPEVVSWILDGLLVTAGTSLLVAKPKTGKSTLARGLALAVSRGEKFLGRNTLKGPVIYLALEEKSSQVRQHFELLGADGSEPVHIHCAAAPQDPIPMLSELVEKIRPVLVIIDPILRMTRIRDASAYQEVNLALEPLVSLARTLNAHLLFVHHMGKQPKADAADQILGSTAFHAVVDTALMMHKTEHFRTLSSSQRYGEDLPETVLEFDESHRSITLGVPREDADLERTGKEILDYLKNADSAKTEKEIVKAVEGRTKLIRTALRSFGNERKLVRAGKGKRGDPFLYSIPVLKAEDHDTPEQETPKMRDARLALERLLLRTEDVDTTSSSPN